MATNWFDIISGTVRMDDNGCVVRKPRTDFEMNFAVWRDMIEEPEKYGDDICEWLELDEKLTTGSGRWRLGAYWLRKEAAVKRAEEDAVREEAKEQAAWRSIFAGIAKQAADAGMKRWLARDVKKFVNRIRNAAVTIQAAVRGHQVRTKQPWRDCCMCLSHRVSPLKTDVGMMCRGCAEQGPYEDETGPLPDPWNWFRADGFVPCYCGCGRNAEGGDYLLDAGPFFSRKCMVYVSRGEEW